MFPAKHERSPLKLLGVFAHPDDETFCAGGILAQHAATGADIMIVSATRGEAGQIRDTQVATRRTLGQTRVQELHQACKYLGVHHVLCLDFGDGKVADLDRYILEAKVTEIIRDFRPHIVLTFGHDGAYGHPDHIAIGAATDAAFRHAGDPTKFPEQLAAGLSPHTPACLYHSYFPRQHGLLLERLVRWLKSLETRFCGTLDFVNGLLVLAEEITTLGYSEDHVRVEWYPPGFHIIEQGEPAFSLYLILSGYADVMREDPDGSLRKIDEMGPGFFFGEEGLATNQPRNAHILARDSVSCLVLSPWQPEPFRGRGRHATLAINACHSHTEHIQATICIDVSHYMSQKIAAITAHRTQCPVSLDLLPKTIWDDLFAQEYFVRMYPTTDTEADFTPSPHRTRLGGRRHYGL
jgi:LmbE family N-acetylglucosaminyl deacetylase